MLDHEQESTALVISGDAAVKVVPANQLPDLDSMDEGMSLAPSYKEFAQGEPVRAVFCGFSEMESQNRTGEAQDDPKIIPLGVFQSTDGVWVHAGANLVSQVRNVPVGTPLQITYKGKERTKRGNDVHVFDVRLLKPAGSSPQERPASAPTQTTSQKPETPAERPSRAEAQSQSGRQTMSQQQENMLLALARGCKQDDTSLDATIKGFFPGESLETLSGEECEIVMGYFRDMMRARKG